MSDRATAESMPVTRTRIGVATHVTPKASLTSDGAVEDFIAAIEDCIADGDYKDVSAPSVTIALTSITNGMWLSYLISPKNFDRQQNLDAIVDLLRRYFPKHYK